MKNIYKIWLFFVVFAIFAAPLTNYIVSYADYDCGYLDEDTLPNTAQPEEESNHDSFLVSYFDNLTQNFGDNQKGSCGYVALGMLLSYYDTALSDNIIPGDYDVNSESSSDGSYVDSTNMVIRHNSPGIRNDNLSPPEDVFNAQTYYNAITQIVNVSLHAKLITIGNELGYYNFNAGQNESPAGTNVDNRKNILNKYLLDVVGLRAGVDYNITIKDTRNCNNLRNAAITQVQLGIPVILGVSGEFEKQARSSGTETEKRRHAVVAYDYDNENDLLYCHMGWGSNSTHATIESYGYTDFTSCSWITWNIPHGCSDNYVVTVDGTSTAYCAQCDDNVIYTYHNGHRYDYEYTCDRYHDASLPYISTHNAFCFCGAKIEETHAFNSIDRCTLCHYRHSHDFYYTQVNLYTHIKHCECGAEIAENHTWDSIFDCIYCNYHHVHSYNNEYNSIDISTHTAICSCGEAIIEAHNYTYSCVSIDANTHKNLCSCGLYETSNHIMNDYDCCIKCDYVSPQHVHDFTYSPMPRSRHRRTCKTCGYATTNACFGTKLPGDDVTYCIKCGQEMESSLPPIVMSNGEEAEELYQNSFLTALYNLQNGQEQG